MDQQDRRLILHEQLKAILGSSNVYFQPPSNVQMKYPAIRYQLNRIRKTYADNKTYDRYHGYEVILIDKNPDSPFVDAIESLPKCEFNRFYTAENLNHWVFIIY